MCVCVCVCVKTDGGVWGRGVWEGSKKIKNETKEKGKEGDGGKIMPASWEVLGGGRVDR